jgi:hypothetical protein
MDAQQVPHGGKDLTDSDWVAHPHGGDGGEDCQRLKARRADLVVYGYVTDAEAFYSYDDYALVSLDGAFYLLNTSGCSCPSPSETWGIVQGPCPLDDIERHVKDNQASGANYGVTARQFDEFLALVECARRAGV